MVYSLRLTRRTLEVGAVIGRTAEVVWDLITDTRSWAEWGPSVAAVASDSRRIRAGATGRIVTSVGGFVVFRIDRFEAGRYWDWIVGGIRATGHRVDALSGDRCRLVFTVPLWAAPYGIVCLLALKRIRGRFEGD